MWRMISKDWPTLNYNWKMIFWSKYYNKKSRYCSFWLYRDFYKQRKIGISDRRYPVIIGVPVANTMPFPPVISSGYWHFIYRSDDFCASVCWIPATLRIFVWRNKFLKLCASSTNILSMPSSSKVTTLSLLGEFRSLSSFASRFRFVFSSCLTLNWLPRTPLSDLIPSVISAIWFLMIFSCRSAETGI